ncbi:Leucine-rich repeat, typical subtype [Corchorus olitorius]|uniref:Leucine-rich repeat, typical subtype n=1 Tax=Corchorus olitorius TaxID=93759 RepID=A0A1R3JYI4_9ROSI|nr:Leucine-rich repeat, typical subtype [Corchorus olitorius]
MHDSEPVINSSAVCHSWKPEEMKNVIDLDTDTMVHQKGQYLKKSRSLGSRLFLEGRVPGNTDMDDGTDQGFSSDSHDHGLVEADGSKLTIVSQKALCAESVQVSSNDVNDEPIFTIGDPQHSEKDGHDISDVPLSGEGANGSGELTPRSAPVIVKSCSMPNIVASEITSGRQSPFKYLTNNPRSCEDVHVLNMRRKEISVHEVDTEVMREGDDIHKNHKSNMENSYYDGYDSYRYSASAKDWIVPVSDEVNSVKILQEDLLVPDWNEVIGKDFMIKRIEDWVNDLQHCSPLEETCELSHPNDHVKEEPIVSNALTATKVDTKVTPGMEAAKRYISSLSASATTAQLANHGLAVIPFLSAFVSLKVLNLSGNAISRIAAGALPRGLHMLNLSKNNISTIEGLRELTRLRVLDLSYNRIVRIGHGLASCSSLKELYLAGNKISEVEGLHRLLKLTVLDLRFNKISTAKCLGQLAANYNSLQAISLEGNPAQKNVGDEHLKKYLQGLLPHLVYYNRQAIKVSTLKDAAERSVRLGISADRGLRSENKATRKSNHGSATHRPSSSSTHAHRATASPRHSRGRNVRLPPSGTKATSNQRNLIDLGSKILNLKSELSMRRTRSEGNLGPL